MPHPLPPPVPWAAKGGARPRAYLLGSGDRPNLREEAARLRPIIDPHLEGVAEDCQSEKKADDIECELGVVPCGGASAHRLSAGRPILRKRLDAFVICPVAPHTLTVRPVVDAADRVFEVVVPQPNEGTMVVVDGRPLWRLMPNDQVRVVKADPRFKLIEPRRQRYYDTLPDKVR